MLLICLSSSSILIGAVFQRTAKTVQRNKAIQKFSYISLYQFNRDTQDKNVFRLHYRSIPRNKRDNKYDKKRASETNPKFTFSY